MQIFPLFRCSLFRSPLYGHIFLVLWFLFLQSSGFGLMTLSPLTVIQLYLPCIFLVILSRLTPCYNLQSLKLVLFVSTDSRGKYNNCIITKLVQNFRSHSAILRIPSELFYNSELVPKAEPSKTGTE